MKLPNTTLKTLLPIFVLGVSALASWALYAYRPQTLPQVVVAKPPQVKVVHAELQTLALNVHSQGVITPREEMDLVTEVSGKVVQVHPALVAGGHFAAHDLLLMVDTRDYDYAITAAEARLAEAKRVLVAEQAQAEQALNEWQALGDGEASALALRKPQLAEAEAKLQAASADLAKTKLNRSRCAIRAPFNGRILKKQAGMGQYLPAGAVVARIYASDVFEVRLPVSLSQLGFLALPLAKNTTKSNAWPKVQLTAELGSQLQHWQGQIVRTEAAIDENTAQVTLVAQVTEPISASTQTAPLLKGLFVQADISGIQQAKVVRLPRNAVNPMQEVKVVNAEQRLDIRRVDVLRTEAETVLVKAGLKPGERVIVSELPVPVAGMQVQVSDD